MLRGLPAGRSSRPVTWLGRVGVRPLPFVVATIVAGCGGGDDSSSDAADFRQAATAATSETSRIGVDVGQAVSTARSKTDADLASTFSGLTARVRVIVTDLKALDPPLPARGKVDDLTSALDTAAEDLDAIAKAASSSQADPARAATEKLVNDSPAISAANKALKAELGSGSE